MLYFLFKSIALKILKIFLEGHCSSPLHREMQNTEIYVYWTMLDWPWKNRCTAEAMCDKCRWRNREPGTTGSTYSLPGCIFCLKEEGKGFQKGKSLLSVVACKSSISHPEGLSLTPLIQWISCSHCSFLWLICNMLLLSPGAPSLWGAVYPSHISTNFKSAFPLSSCSGA